jgi:hypothetical protein
LVDAWRRSFDGAYIKREESLRDGEQILWVWVLLEVQMGA